MIGNQPYFIASSDPLTGLGPGGAGAIFGRGANSTMGCLPPRLLVEPPRPAAPPPRPCGVPDAALAFSCSAC